MTFSQIISRKEKLEKELIEINKQIELEKNKTQWVKISKTEEISTTQLHNNKTYAEILKSLTKGERIADYPLLQKLRNSGEFDFLKDFWVFIPNPDKISEKNNFVARFIANSDWAYFGCNRNPTNSDVSLGVFVVRRIK